MVRAAGPPRERILAAARELFFQRGFARVSTDELAQAAAVSKATLYKHFTGMKDVLRAVVEAEVEGFEQGVPVVVETREAFRSALTQFGANLLHFLNQAEIIRFSQLMFEEARSDPPMAQDFYACAYGRTLNDLARLMQQGLDLGFLRSGHSAAHLAEQLLGIWEGFGFIRALLGLTARPFENPEACSGAGVLTLLEGHVQAPSSKS